MYVNFSKLVLLNVQLTHRNVSRGAKEKINDDWKKRCI